MYLRFLVHATRSDHAPVIKHICALKINCKIYKIGAQLKKKKKKKNHHLFSQNEVFQL